MPWIVALEVHEIGCNELLLELMLTLFSTSHEMIGLVQWSWALSEGRTALKRELGFGFWD